MATWKRLTEHGGTRKVDVNIDLVMFMRPFDTHTELHFGDKPLGVKETPDQIHTGAVTLRTK